MGNYRVFMVAAFLTVMTAANNGIAADYTILTTSDGIQYLSDKIVIGIMPDSKPLNTGEFDTPGFSAGYGSLDRLCEQYGVVKVEKYYKGKLKPSHMKESVDRMYSLATDGRSDVWEAAAVISGEPYLQYAEVHYVPQPCYEPNDPSIGNQWFLGNIRAYEAWDIVRGEETDTVIIGIVDTGVYYDHPDLEPNMWINPPEDLNNNGIFDNFPENEGGDLNWLDDDDNGYEDDVCGIDMGARDADPAEEYPDHGTHVAGCASEATDNEIGGAGPAFSAKIIAAKAAGTGGSLIATNVCIIYCVDVGAHFVNCSYGNYIYSNAERQIIESAFEDGCLVVAAAGNDNTDVEHYPAGYEKSLCVAATANGDVRAGFTNYGDWIDISSPGVNIYSTWAHDSYSFLQGTSMASPVCAGAAALVKAQDINRTTQDIWDIITQSADSVALYSRNPNWVGLLGAGRVDAFGGLAYQLYPNLRAISSEQTITNDDGDGIPNPGEALEVIVTIRNFWAEAANVHGSVSTDDADLTIIDGEADYGDIGSDSEGENSSDPFTMNISQDALVHAIPVEITITADGGYSVTDTFYIDVSLNQKNFPVTASGNIEGCIGLFDVDGDYANEIVFGTAGDSIFALNHDGSSVPGYPVEVAGDIVGGMAIGQMDGNAGYQAAFCTKNGHLYVKDTDGNDMPGFPKQEGQQYYSTPMLVDLDDDDFSEVVFAAFGDGRVYAYNVDGTAVSGFPVETGSKIYGGASAGNLDADDDLEIAAGGLDSNLHAWNRDGSAVDGFPAALGDIIWAAPAMGDLDEDNRDEIMVGTQSNQFYAIKHDGSIMNGFPRDLGAAIKADAALADIDADGVPEIFVGTNGALLYGITSEGEDIENWPVSVGSSLSASPVIVDIDGDGSKEIIVASIDGSIYAFNIDGSAVRNFPLPTYGTITSSSPAVDDIDGDGDLEIVVGFRQAANNLAVYDYKANSAVYGLDWRMYGHDMDRRHLYYDYYLDADEESAELPSTYSLNQNYPNPFNPITTIEYTLPENCEVNLSVYNLMGQKVATLVDSPQKAGFRSVSWNASEYSSGLYFYRLAAGDKKITRKMALVK